MVQLLEESHSRLPLPNFQSSLQIMRLGYLEKMDLNLIHKIHELSRLEKEKNQGFDLSQRSCVVVPI